MPTLGCIVLATFTTAAIIGTVFIVACGVIIKAFDTAHFWEEHGSLQ